MIAGIYEIRNIITGDCYIGSSINLLQRAYNKYSKEFFKFNIIEVIKEHNLLIEREQYFLNKINPKYNISPTAGSPLGCKQSKESCEKRRNYAINNNIIPPESTWKNKQESVLMLDCKTLKIINSFDSLSEACRFIGKDSTFASTISSCCKNKRYSAYGYRWAFNKEDIKNLRQKKESVSWNKGKKVGNKLSKKVKQFDLNMNFIKEWNSVKEAEKLFGKGISNCALERSKTSNGFIWKY